MLNINSSHTDIQCGPHQNEGSQLCKHNTYNLYGLKDDYHQGPWHHDNWDDYHDNHEHDTIFSAALSPDVHIPWDMENIASVSGLV